MDEKKVREAIEIMKTFRRGKQERKKLLCFHGNDKYNSELLERKIEACNTAIEALEKQLAIKPKEVVGGIYREFYECKNCGSEIEPLDIYEDYCKWCGQRLDWTES